MESRANWIVTPHTLPPLFARNEDDPHDSKVALSHTEWELSSRKYSTRKIQGMKANEREKKKCHRIMSGRVVCIGNLTRTIYQPMVRSKNEMLSLENDEFIINLEKWYNHWITKALRTLRLIVSCHQRCRLFSAFVARKRKILSFSSICIICYPPVFFESTIKLITIGKWYCRGTHFFTQVSSFSVVAAQPQQDHTNSRKKILSWFCSFCYQLIRF